MAKVELEFEGTGGGLFREIRELKDAVVALGGAHAKVQEDIQRDVQATVRTSQALTTAIEGTTQVVATLGKTAASAGTGGLASGIREGIGAADKLGDSVAEVKAQATLAARELGKVGATANTVRITAAEYKKLSGELQKAGVAQDQLLESVGATVLEQKELNNEAFKLDEIILDSGQSVDGLSQQLRAAKREASELAARFGKNSEQALAAQKRVGELANSVDTLNKRFDAFNPGNKLAAFQQLTFSLVNGLSAVGGAIQLLAGENEGIQRLVGTMQTLLFAVSGLGQFLGDFPDALGNIKAVLFGSTAALEANTIAAEANAVGTATAGTAAAGSATGFKAATSAVLRFTASLLTNPIFLAAAAIAALGYALFFMGRDAERAKLQLQQLQNELDLFRDLSESTNALESDLRKLDLERRKLGVKDNDFKTQAILTQEATQIERDAINEKLKNREASINKLQSFLDRENKLGNLDKDQQKEVNDQINALTNERLALFDDLIRAGAQGTLDLARIAQAELTNAKQDAQERKALREDLLVAEKDFSTKLKEARRAAAEDDPFRRVELDKQANEEELKELERGFLRKIALIEVQKRLGVAAFRELTEREKEARADALIDAGSIALPAQQQEQINALRLLAEEQYLKALSVVYEDEAKARAEIMAASAEKELAIFEIGLDERAEALRKAGVDDDAIRRFQQRERETFARESAIKAIELDTQLQEAIIEGRENNGEIEKVFERRKQVELLAIQLAGAQVKLALIKDDDKKETQLRRQELQNVINEIKKQQNILANTPVDINLLDLLGIAPEDQAEVEQAFQTIGQAAVQALSAGIAAQRAELDQRISLTDQIIEDSQRRTDELRSQLEQEEEDRRQGYANNVDALKGALAQEKLAGEKALAEKKALQAEQAKLARQQVVVDSLSQASSLATGVANLIKTWSTLPLGVGLVSAFAQAAAIFSFFKGFSARMKAASAQAFYKGTKNVKLGPGESEGVDTVHAMLTKDEAVIPVAKNKKHKRLVDAIIDDDFSKVRAIDLKPLLQGTGIRLDDDKVEAAQRQGREVEAQERVQARGPGTKALEERVEQLTEVVKGFRQQEKDRPTVTTLADGRLMVTKGSDVHFITPRKR
jgi:hypothetical protein